MLKCIVECYKEKRSKHKIEKIKMKVAKEFNDLYTYRMKRNKSYQWMCPTCNTIHDSIAYTRMTGHQFPSCCMQPIGHRLFLNIKTGKL